KRDGISWRSDAQHEPLERYDPSAAIVQLNATTLLEASAFESRSYIVYSARDGGQLRSFVSRRHGQHASSKARGSRRPNGERIAWFRKREIPWPSTRFRPRFRLP